MKMKRMLLCIVFIFPALVINAFAADDEEEQVIQYERTDSLELPGLTAGCHVCEWRPKLNSKPAPEQCGLDDAGKPITGLFECGYSEDCERVCNFLSCGDS
jgi:hypothetical protein